MVDKEIIIKTFDNILLKCSPSDKIRRIGKNVNVSEYTNDKNEKVTRYDYGDGISVELTNMDKYMEFEDGSGGYDVESLGYTNVTYNGKSYPILSESTETDGGPDNFFKHQKEEIISKYGEDGWEFYKEYANTFGSYQGWNLNSILRGKKSVDDITDEYGDFYVSPFLLENHSRFVEMERNLSLDKEDFVSMRVMKDLHRNDSIGKKIVSDEGHTCTSIAGELVGYETYADPYNDWFVFTLNDKGSGVHGGYFGSAIQEFDGYDFEREVNYVPGQRFERLVIDDANKIIIQRPLPLE